MDSISSGSSGCIISTPSNLINEPYNNDDSNVSPLLRPLAENVISGDAIISGYSTSSKLINEPNNNGGSSVTLSQREESTKNSINIKTTTILMSGFKFPSQKNINKKFCSKFPVGDINEIEKCCNDNKNISETNLWSSLIRLVQFEWLEYESKLNFLRKNANILKDQDVLGEERELFPAKRQLPKQKTRTTFPQEREVNEGEIIQRTIKKYSSLKELKRKLSDRSKLQKTKRQIIKPTSSEFPVRPKKSTSRFPCVDVVEGEHLKVESRKPEKCIDMQIYDLNKMLESFRTTSRAKRILKIQRFPLDLSKQRKISINRFPFLTKMEIINCIELTEQDEQFPQKIVQTFQNINFKASSDAQNLDTLDNIMEKEYQGNEKGSVERQLKVFGKMLKSCRKSTELEKSIQASLKNQNKENQLSEVMGKYNLRDNLKTKRVLNMSDLRQYKRLYCHLKRQTEVQNEKRDNSGEILRISNASTVRRISKCSNLRKLLKKPRHEKNLYLNERRYFLQVWPTYAEMYEKRTNRLKSFIKASLKNKQNGKALTKFSFNNFEEQIKDQQELKTVPLRGDNTFLTGFIHSTMPLQKFNQQQKSKELTFLETEKRNFTTLTNLENYPQTNFSYDLEKSMINRVSDFKTQFKPVELEKFPLTLRKNNNNFPFENISHKISYKLQLQEIHHLYELKKISQSLQTVILRSGLLKCKHVKLTKFPLRESLVKKFYRKFPYERDIVKSYNENELDATRHPYTIDLNEWKILVNSLNTNKQHSNNVNIGKSTFMANMSTMTQKYWQQQRQHHIYGQNTKNYNEQHALSQVQYSPKFHAKICREQKMNEGIIEYDAFIPQMTIAKETKNTLIYSPTTSTKEVERHFSENFEKMPMSHHDAVINIRDERICNNEEDIDEFGLSAYSIGNFWVNHHHHQQMSTCGYYGHAPDAYEETAGILRASTPSMSSGTTSVQNTKRIGAATHHRHRQRHDHDLDDLCNPQVAHTVECSDVRDTFALTVVGSGNFNRTGSLLVKHDSTSSSPTVLNNLHEHQQITSTPVSPVNTSYWSCLSSLQAARPQEFSNLRGYHKGLTSLDKSLPVPKLSVLDLYESNCNVCARPEIDGNQPASIIPQEQEDSVLTEYSKAYESELDDLEFGEIHEYFEDYGLNDEMKIEMKSNRNSSSSAGRAAGSSSGRPTTPSSASSLRSAVDSRLIGKYDTSAYSQYPCSNKSAAIADTKSLTKPPTDRLSQSSAIRRPSNDSNASSNSISGRSTPNSRKYSNDSTRSQTSHRSSMDSTGSAKSLTHRSTTSEKSSNDGLSIHKSGTNSATSKYPSYDTSSTHRSSVAQRYPNDSSVASTQASNSHRSSGAPPLKYLRSSTSLLSMDAPSYLPTPTVGESPISNNRGLSLDTPTERSRLRRQRKLHSQGSQDEEEDPVKRLERLRARITASLSEVKDVLKSYKSMDAEDENDVSYHSNRPKESMAREATPYTRGLPSLSASQSRESISLAKESSSLSRESLPLTRDSSPLTRESSCLSSDSTKEETKSGPVTFRFVKKIRRRSFYDEGQEEDPHETERKEQSQSESKEVNLTHPEELIPLNETPMSGQDEVDKSKPHNNDGSQPSITIEDCEKSSQKTFQQSIESSPKISRESSPLSEKSSRSLSPQIVNQSEVKRDSSLSLSSDGNISPDFSRKNYITCNTTAKPRANKQKSEIQENVNKTNIKTDKASVDEKKVKQNIKICENKNEICKQIIDIEQTQTTKSPAGALESNKTSSKRLSLTHSGEITQTKSEADERNTESSTQKLTLATSVESSSFDQSNKSLPKESSPHRTPLRSTNEKLSPTQQNRISTANETLAQRDSSTHQIAFSTQTPPALSNSAATCKDHSPPKISAPQNSVESRKSPSAQLVPLENVVSSKALQSEKPLEIALSKIEEYSSTKTAPLTIVEGFGNEKINKKDLLIAGNESLLDRDRENKEVSPKPSSSSTKTTTNQESSILPILDKDKKSSSPCEQKKTSINTKVEDEKDVLNELPLSKKKTVSKSKESSGTIRRASLAAVEGSQIKPPVQLATPAPVQRRPSDSEAIIKKKLITTKTKISGTIAEVTPKPKMLKPKKSSSATKKTLDANADQKPIIKDTQQHQLASETIPVVENNANLNQSMTTSSSLSSTGEEARNKDATLPNDQMPMVSTKQMSHDIIGQKPDILLPIQSQIVHPHPQLSKIDEAVKSPPIDACSQSTTLQITTTKRATNDQTATATKNIKSNQFDNAVASMLEENVTTPLVSPSKASERDGSNSILAATVPPENLPNLLQEAGGIVKQAEAKISTKSSQTTDTPKTTPSSKKLNEPRDSCTSSTSLNEPQVVKTSDIAAVTTDTSNAKTLVVSSTTAKEPSISIDATLKTIALDLAATPPHQLPIPPASSAPVTTSSVATTSLAAIEHLTSTVTKSPLSEKEQTSPTIGGDGAHTKTNSSPQISISPPQEATEDTVTKPLAGAAISEASAVSSTFIPDKELSAVVVSLDEGKTQTENMPELKQAPAPVQTAEIPTETNDKPKKIIIIKKIVRQTSVDKSKKPEANDSKIKEAVLSPKEESASDIPATDTEDGSKDDKHVTLEADTASSIPPSEGGEESSTDAAAGLPPKPIKVRKVKNKVIIKRQKRKLSIGDTFFLPNSSNEDTTPPEVETLEKAISYVTDTEEEDHEEETPKVEEEKKPLKSCINKKEYNIGDEVLYADRWRRNQIRWKRGRVKEQITSISYLIEIDGKDVSSHINYLKKYTGRKVNFGGKEYLEIDYEQLAEEEERAERVQRRSFSIWNMVLKLNIFKRCLKPKKDVKTLSTNLAFNYSLKIMIL
ncbi:uncharacterized protein LOC142236222 [Haematobia irritans]|uniref:uncharacterized protein LOC142236222 n=1 Tax=Haematobia irritans TaxID=7368 RepID=UPI003F50463D